ncbi:hypothetical protein Rhe02_16440 [Rhizocola hellebori]|uniref:Squalene cyclase C-terminal domain-containing protein n=1 Tax=Rhizocola hellebori TaxID=1392758 RepID=A0A8J3Q5A6_9ACTN|nr:prenyltransferase/squalene oxidase repeat-containing protein [Rhizocola hellebori]GIH03577.1 hypothetical protein Rhe02_16440 [Rhizocola hellebori]
MRKLFSILAAAGLAVAIAAPAQAAPAWDSDGSWSKGVKWLEGELVNGALPAPAWDPATPADPDWGMTIDMLIAVRASKLEQPLAQALSQNIAANVDSYTTPSWGAGLIIGGATAKVLFASVISGGDPLSFGGHNMRQRTLDRIDAGGWIHDSDGNGGNMFDQSLAVLGLAGSGGVPDNVVQYLLSQQCAEGGFPLFPTAGPIGNCQASAADANDDVKKLWPEPHVDGTAMAIQALYGAGKKQQADKAVAWLAGMQQPNGSFFDRWASPVPSTNSTGLAAQALYAGGKVDQASKAAAFIRTLQLTTANAGAASAHVGAIAKGTADFADGTADGICEVKPEFENCFIDEMDPWHRATTQALLAFTLVPMHRIGVDSPPTPSSPSSPSPSASAPGSGGGLPVTGPAAFTMAGVGAAVVLAGMLLLALARRRRVSVR